MSLVDIFSKEYDPGVLNIAWQKKTDSDKGCYTEEFTKSKKDEKLIYIVFN